MENRFCKNCKYWLGSGIGDRYGYCFHKSRKVKDFLTRPDDICKIKKHNGTETNN